MYNKLSLLSFIDSYKIYNIHSDQNESKVLLFEEINIHDNKTVKVIPIHYILQIIKSSNKTI